MSSVAALSMATWPMPRKVAAALFSIVCVVGLACAAIYLSAVLFLVLNKADPRQARFTSIAHYWQLYADDSRLRKSLVASMVVSGGGLVVLLPAALFAAARPRRALHGDARFATAAEVERAGLSGNGGSSPSILVGRYGKRFLALPGQLSVMLSAPTRSGKGVGVVVPNLLNWPDSVVVLDIKGENFDVTAGYRAAHGQAVYAFSPFDELARSHRWNPLSTVRTSPLHRVGDLLSIGQVFFPNDGGSTSSEAFFNDQARNLFLGIGLYLLETPELPRTIGEMLRQSSGKGQPLKDHFAAAIKQRAEDAESTRPPLSEECVDALQRLLSNSENTLSSIVSTFNAPLVIFADAVVDAATSADDFRLEDVRRRRMSIYVRIPPNRLANARPLLNLFFSQLVSLNTRTLPAQDKAPSVQCLLVNDEFAAMGRVSIISSAAAFLAGYNLRLLTVVQAMSQLDAVYGEKEARTFATNHGLQILYAPREQRDADEYSAMLGHFTERATSRGRSRSFSGHGHTTVSRNESEQRRALLLPQEFKELGSERLVIVMENCKPILCEKIRYHREKVFKARLLPPPAVPPMDMDLHFAKVQRRWTWAPDEIGADQGLRLEQLALETPNLPDFTSAKSDVDAGAMVERYVIKRAMVSIGDKPIGQTEYRFRGDTSRVAFTEFTFRLATDTNSPSVARSMVDVAEARDWKALRVSGHEEFRRMVWFEASLRGVRTIGYEPLPSDMAWLRSERDTRQVNRIEPTVPAESPSTSGKASARGSGNRKTVLAAIEAVLVAQRVPEKRREAIMAAAADNLAKRIAAGEVHRVKVYDKAAPQQQAVVRPAPEQQRARERTAHVR